MKDEKEKANMSAPQPPCYYQQPSCQDDEISLVELWQVLARRWRWIAGTLLLVVLAAVVYLLTAIPSYEAEAVLLPPEVRHMQTLNIPDINDVDLEKAREEIYQEFVRNLRSSSLRRQFFDEHNLIAILGSDPASSEETVFQRAFDEALEVRVGDSEDDNVFVTFRGKHPELMADWVNDFVGLAAGTTIENTIGAIRVNIANQQEVLREQIRIDREFAEQRRADRIAVLEEQIVIARELNIISRGDAPLRRLEGNNLGVAVSTADEPEYLRGVNDLVAEKQTLEKRKEHDPFIAGLRQKQVKLENLASGLRMLQAAEAEMHPARFDQKAIIPEYPASPNKKLTLALSLVLGGMLGIFAAFFAEFIAHAASREEKDV